MEQITNQPDYQPIIFETFATVSLDIEPVLRDSADMVWILSQQPDSSSSFGGTGLAGAPLQSQPYGDPMC